MAKKPILSPGQRFADSLTRFCGSWIFVGIFFGFIFGWIVFIHCVDPYPYILLNLILSCLAAIQAPIIMISNKYQERLQTEDLHRKIDEIRKILEKRASV